MKKNIFTSSIRILIVTLLVLAVFMPKKYSETAMMIAMAVWLLIVGGSFILKQFKKRKGKKKTIQLIKVNRSTPLPNAEPTPVLTPKASVSPEFEQDQELMMQHISLRIAEKLKSAYPLSTWQWIKKPSVHDLLNGTTARIKVDGMDKFTHADITFDRFGRIHVTPMEIGLFGTATSDTDSGETEDTPKEPPVVDVKAWYELIGQTVLETQITNLNANGHSKLTIKENGDIVINRQKKEVLVTTLDAFPAKNYWEDLVKLLEENELNAKIAGNSLQVSWIM